MSYFDFDTFTFEDKRMADIKNLCSQLAPTQASILISGAAATGKTSLAHYIFRKSKSAGLIELNCELIGPNLGEINCGTLILENLDCASFELQNELIKIVERTGQQRPRFISTTRRDLRSLVKQQLFRQDLFYKLAVVNMDLPMLADRKNDFNGIVNFIMEVSQIIHGKCNLKLSSAALERLTSWAWPGNIRELENVIERAVVLCNKTELDVAEIQFEPIEENNSANFNPGMSLSQLEKRLILQTLELTAQNRTRAAQMLGISIRTLRNKLNEYRMEGAL